MTPSFSGLGEYSFGIVAGMSSQTIHAALAPWLTMTAQAANALTPITPPDPGQLAHIFYTGDITSVELSYWLKLHGIDYTTTPVGVDNAALYQRLWRKVIIAGQARLSIEDARRLNIRGDMTDIELRDRIYFTGLAQENRWEVVQNPEYLIDVGLSLELWRKGLIGDNILQMSLQNEGFTGIAEQGFHKLSQLSFMTAQMAASVYQRGIDNDAIAQRFGLDDGYNAQYQWFAHANGWDWSNRDVGAGPAPLAQTNWSQVHWRSTRPVLGLGDIYEAYRRLRPGVDPNNINNVLVGAQFDDGDFDAAMHLLGYTARQANILRNLRYTPISIRHIRMLHATKVVDLNGVVGVFMDNGMSPDNAMLVAQAYANQDWYTANEKGATRLRTAILNAYRQGTISRTNAAGGLYVTAFTTPKQLADYNALNQQQQAAVALADPGTYMELEAIEAEVVIDRAKQGMSAIRKAYLTGAINTDTVLQSLLALGITSERAGDYIRRWQLDILDRYKFVGVGTITKWFVDGFINRDEALARLLNLGYSNRDAVLLLNVAIANQSAVAGKTAAKIAIQNSKANAALAAKQLKAQQEVIKKALAQLNKDASVATLEKWYKSCILDPGEFTQAMLDRGIDPAFIAIRIKFIDGQRKGPCPWETKDEQK